MTYSIKKNNDTVTYKSYDRVGKKDYVINKKPRCSDLKKVEKQYQM